MGVDQRVRAWIAAACGATVVSATPIAGGVASTVDLVVLADGSTVVLRRVPPLAHVPGHHPDQEIRTEAVALGLLGDRPWAPTLIAADPDGSRCGVPASIQTVVPGRVEVVPSGHWVEVLAAAISTVAQAGVDAASLPAFDPWVDPATLPPVWTSHPARWRTAAAALEGWSPRGDRLVHRDLHPGNVLVDRRRLGGVVDWVHARRGPTQADVSRCRVEVAVLAGLGTADDLLQRCDHLVSDYDPRWDLLVAAEVAPWSDSLLAFNAQGAQLDLATIHTRLDDLVGSALHALDASS